MLAEAPIVFEQPIWLLLLVLIVPVLLIAIRSIGGLSRTKAFVTFAFRTLLIVLLAMALARPSWQKQGKGVTVTILLDRSQSVPWAKKTEAVEFLAKAAEAKENREDRVAVITVAESANIVAMPDQYTAVSAGQEPADLAATNLAEGVRIALALAPPDTANRFLLASDGNETEGSVLEVAELARANNVPIDVLLLEYEHENEVIFERLIAPPRVRQGQTANVKMVLRSQAFTTGTVYLSQNGRRLDLNGDGPGQGLAVALEPGPRVVPVSLSMDTPGPQEFEALLEVDDPGDVPDNNTAGAVTFVGSEGRVLFIESDPSETEHLLRAMAESQIEVDRVDPASMQGGLVYLSGYDAVVLADIPRWSIDDEQDRMFHAYVHDLGGGLIMLGGPTSLGAGGWIDSETSKVLPVKLDPPSIRQMPRGALVLIMHSCEMAQGNFWGQKVAQSAIEALSRLDYIGILEFNWGNANAVQGISWALPLQEAGDKQAAIAATKQMVVGDMPDFESSMKVALTGLQTRAARASQKHVLIISDGDPSPPSPGLIQQYVQSGVTVTTVMVGGHGTGIDRNKMNSVATQTGGRFYNVTNPKNLPGIFIKEAQLVSRSLIQENDIYQPQVVSRLPGPVEGFAQVPVVEGYVLTAEREGLAQTPIAIVTSEGRDPLYANWNYGLGKAIAFTSDTMGRWGAAWVAWSEFRAFWEQSMRWVMRPSAPSNITVNTQLDGDRAVVELEALESDASFLNFLRTRAVVVAPDGSAAPLALQQTGPGRYRAEFVTSGPGAYLVNVNYAGGSSEAPIQGNLQAAVSVPYAREFRTVKHNAALLRDLAARTGGRVLSWESPELLDMFDRRNLEVPRSQKQIWDLLAIIAAGLFLLDVAARRLALDRAWLQKLMGRAVASRGEASTATVSAWKRTKEQIKQPPKKTMQGETAAAPSARFEADETDAGRSLQIGAAASKARRVPSPEAEQPPLPPPGEAEDYTSRLLAAKRRARKSDSDQGGSGEQPDA